MRSWAILSAALATVGLGVGQARACPEEELVQSWYGRYLGRPLDPVGRDLWVGQLRAGAPVEQVEATILASDEYFHRHGCCPRRFVRALSIDLLGHRPCEHEIDEWAVEFRRCGCRTTMVRRFLHTRARLAHRLHTPRPLYQPEPAYTPAYRPAPVYVPRPASRGLSIGVRYRYGW